MMKMKTKTAMNGGSVVVGGGGDGSGESRPMDWEVRPGGMLVQKRDSDSDRESTPAPMLRVRVKYGSTYHEISVGSQATFGELKKMLAGATGLHHQDQKLIFKNKERDSKAFLDISGVRDRSKLVLVEDPISQEKRFLEMRKNAKMEKASKTVSAISLEVDRLAHQVSAMESVITKGGNVAENDVLNLIELLMNELLKLDSIIGDGDVKLQRKMQVRRVQKYVETLDMLKIKNSMPSTNSSQRSSSNHQRHTRSSYTNGKLSTIQEEPPRDWDGGSLLYHQSPPQEQSTFGTVVTTKWETFDSSPAASSTFSSAASIDHPGQLKLNWEFFE